MLNFYEGVRRLLFSYDWDVVEIEGAFFKFTWGVWMLLPFPVFRSVSVYSQVAPEDVWGITLTILGAFHLYAVFTRNLLWRRVMSFIAFLFWLFTVILLYMQAPTAALLPTFTIIGFFMGVNFLRLSAVSKNIV